MTKYTIAHSILRIRGYDQNSGNCKVGQTLVIRREHSNPKDEFAVAVMDLESWRVVGRVPKPTSRECSKMLDWLDKNNIETKVGLLEVQQVLHHDPLGGKSYWENQAKIKVEYLTSAAKREDKYTKLVEVAAVKWPFIEVFKGSHPTTLSETLEGGGLMSHGIVSGSDGHGVAEAKSSSPTFKFDEKDDEESASQAWTKPRAKTLSGPRDSDNKWTNKKGGNKRYKTEEN